jgi:predicted SAM-dependent methyltransferase
MKIAILYICTGKYTIFWDTFYRSAEQFFLPNADKNYFVFTDDPVIPDNGTVFRIEQANLGWPGNTIYRYRLFWSIRSRLDSYDYIFFFNANSEFAAVIGEEILPTKEEGIVVVQHPGFFDKRPDEFTYERNKESKAAIPFGEGKHYICGGVNGGRTNAYLDLINTLRIAIEEDNKKNITAIWHDESHINKYIIDHKYKLLTPSFCYPEGWNIPFEKVILIRDKNRHGGHDILRGIPNKRRSLRQKVVDRIYSKLRRIKTRFNVIGNFPNKLHLGCGPIRINGFCNIDIAYSPAVDILDNVKTLKRFSTEYASEIYACHVLEHFPHSEIPIILKRWHTILKKGGSLRISVPDTDRIVKIYMKNWEHFQTSGNSPRIGLIYGGQLTLYDFHKTGFNFCWLKYLLENAGFHTIQEYPHTPHFAGENINDGSLAHEPFDDYLSLNIMAYK